MKANEAWKASKDGCIYLNGRTAVRHAQYHLIWLTQSNFGSSSGQVSDADLFSDDWQPSKPEVKCPACQEANELSNTTNLYPQNMQFENMATHLRKYHCTCKGKHEPL